MKPTLYLLFGYPGAGKTTAAKLIEEVTGGVRLSSDEIRLELFPKPTFSEAEHQKLYNVLDERTKELLAQGKSVIYDANLNRYQHRAEKYDICHQTGAKSVLFWLKTPREIAKDRALQDSRQHLWPPNEAPADMFDRIAGVLEEPQSEEHAVVIDGTRVSSSYIKQLLSATL